VKYFEKLRESANPVDGSVILPGRFRTWYPNTGGEHMVFVTQELCLLHSDWVPKEPLFKTYFDIIA